MAAMPDQLQIVVAHTLPGRLRLRLSHPPRSVSRTVRQVKNHPGLNEVIFTPETGNLLITFDPERVNFEEIVLRVAIGLSSDYDYQPLTIKTNEAKVALGPLALLSGISLLAGHAMAWLAPGSGAFTALRLVGGISTTAAIGDHIYIDLKNTGRFHPEALSIGYLLNSLIRGNILKGATIAWMMTFARHLMEPPQKVLKLETKTTAATCDDRQCAYEAKISSEFAARGFPGLLARLPHLVFGLYTDLNLNTGDRLFREVQKLSRDHDTVLEGLENLHRGIRLNVAA